MSIDPMMIMVISVTLLIIALLIGSPNIIFLATRTPFYEIRLHKRNVFVKRVFKKQNTANKTFKIKSYDGEFVYPTLPEEYFIKGISKLVNYDVNNSNPITTVEPDKKPIKGQKKMTTKDEKGDIKVIFKPVMMYPNVMNPIVLKELLMDDSVRKVIKQPKQPMDWLVPIIIILIVVVGLLGVVYLFTKGGI